MLLNINLQLWKKTKQFTDLFLEFYLFYLEYFIGLHV